MARISPVVGRSTTTEPVRGPSASSAARCRRQSMVSTMSEPGRGATAVCQTSVTARSCTSTVRWPTPSVPRSTDS